MRARLSRIIGVCAAVVLAVACSAESDTGGLAPSASAARERWSQHRPASYQFTMAKGCECLADVTRPVIVTVIGTTVTSRVYADNGVPVPAQFAPSFTTIDALFDLLQAARDKNAAVAAATFDAVLGYPLTIALDYSSIVADDESWYTVTNFKAQ